VDGFPIRRARFAREIAATFMAVMVKNHLALDLDFAGFAAGPNVSFKMVI
jgi:hypothetical protein